jgi:hypothetical protein
MTRYLFVTITVLLLQFGKTTNAQTSYNYNQAKAFNEYIGAAEGKWTFNSDSQWLRQDITFTRVSLNKKDMQGNDLYRYDFSFKDGTLCSLVPDNTIFPMAYVMVRKDGNLFYSGHFNNNYSYIALGSGLIAAVSFAEASSIDKDNEFKRIVIFEQGLDPTVDRKKNYIQSGSFTKGGGKGKPYGNLSELILAEKIQYEHLSDGTMLGTEYNGIPFFYEQLRTFLKSQISKAETLGHKKSFNDFQDGDYYYYGEPYYVGDKEVTPGPVRLKFEKEDGLVKNILVQNSFTDGKFYDKEKFFVKCPLNPVGNDGKTLIAFGDKIIATSMYDKYFNDFLGVFSKLLYDIEAMNYTVDFDSKFWLIQKTSEKYFCTTELETTYSASKDELSFNNFFKKLFDVYSRAK